MYKIINLDNVEKVFTNDAELTHYVRQIAIENGDFELSITCKGEAVDYLEEYCDNLTFETVTFAVDIPQVNSEGAPIPEFFNVDTFPTREAALKFAQDNFGADENGMICLISSY